MKSGSLERPLIMSVYPKSRLSIAVSVGGLAVFVVFASLFMVSFYGINHSERLDSVSVINGTIVNSPDEDIVMDVRKSNSRSEGRETFIVYTDNKTIVDPALHRDSESVAHHSKPDVNAIGIDKNQHSTSQDTHQVENVNLPYHPPVSKTTDMVDQPVGNRGSSDEGGVCNLSLSINGTNGIKTAADPIPNLEGLTSALPAQGNINEADSSYSDCDLYHGKWVYDSTGPLYSNNSCPVLSEMQNCQRNGRLDKEYENWRWKPEHCDLPRFDAKKFLELMRGKTLAFIGDSVARNQMESMLCMLWQVEVPKNRGNKKMHRYYFRSTSTMIVRIWSSWLVRKTSEPFDFAPEGLVKLHLDAPDNFIMEPVPQFDVIVLSSGHWFTKHSAYILNNEILGGQLWWPDKARPIKINNVEAFGISTETILTSLVTHPNYTGLTIARTYSPDHYKGGAWNTGGSCSGKTKPALDSEIVENHFTKIMHDKQVNGFKRALTKKTNKSRFKLMDITEAFGYRHDGHPGPYRSPDSNKITKVGRDSKPPPEDCLHWCMPGPVDTWNELLMEIITKEFESSAWSS